MSDKSRIVAEDFVHASGSIVESARLLANHVSNLLQQEDTSILVSFAELKGVTSSYFTMFFRDVFSTHSPATYQEKVTCTFASELQESIYRRSWEVVCREAA